MVNKAPTLESLEQFLFEAAPYSTYSLSETFSAKELYNFKGGTKRIDGHCPYCKRTSTFTIDFQHIPSGDAVRNIASRFSHDKMELECVRNKSHRIYYYFRIVFQEVEKIGQYPSLADISNDEVTAYRGNMEKEDANEFHKAIGLAAHGVGVGSFVYLRRVFERLVYGRFEEFKDAEGWKNEDFYAVRMEDKINLLKDHLPEFLVENRKVYSILSKGIHELDEKECLSWFEVMKQSIIIILEDDKKKKEELDRRQVFKTAISGFSVKGES